MRVPSVCMSSSLILVPSLVFPCSTSLSWLLFYCIILFCYVLLCLRSLLFPNDRQKGRRFERGDLEKKFERIMGGKAVIKIYNMRKQSIFSKGAARVSFPSHGSSAFPICYIVFCCAFLPPSLTMSVFSICSILIFTLFKNNSYSLEYLLCCCFYYCVCGKDSELAFCSQEFSSEFQASFQLRIYIFSWTF